MLKRCGTSKKATELLCFKWRCQTKVTRLTGQNINLAQKAVTFESGRFLDIHKFIVINFMQRVQHNIYLSFNVSALRPCHGKWPLRKYIYMWPRASRSSLRDCSLPWNISKAFKEILYHPLIQYYGLTKSFKVRLNSEIEINWGGKWK